MTGANLLRGLDWVVDDVASRIYFHGAVGGGGTGHERPVGEAVLEPEPVVLQDQTVIGAATPTQQVTG